MALKFLKSKADKRRDEFAKMAMQFGNDAKRKDVLLIMGDPDTDVMVATYKGLYSAIHRKRNIAVVRNIVDLNRDTRDGALLNQFIQDLAYMVVALGDKLVNERTMKKGLSKAKLRAAEKGQPMVVFGAEDEKGNTRETIAVK
jgi:hypothetical protein